MNHRRGYKDAEEAMSSKAYLSNPGATVSHCRPCGLVHVDLPKPKPVSLPKAPRRETGFPARVKLMARTRAGHGEPRNARCEACGQWLGLYGGEVQHRVARGMGGSSGPVVNGITNAALLCGSAAARTGCHGLAEARDPEMKTRGFFIRSGNGPEHDPRYVPVMLGNSHGSWVTVWLGEDGRYHPERPAKAVALWPR